MLIIICIVIVGEIPIGKYIGTNFDYWYTTITPITITQTVVESEERRELLYFCNIPVQNTSGTISRSRGTIQTTDNLTYWYLNENGEGTFDSALAENSNIVFLEESQSPYVEIVVYSTKIISKNHNNGTEETTTEKTWAEYKFYLPKTIMQYNLE